MSIPAATLLDQVSAGGVGPQIGGSASFPAADTGIFAALLGNIGGAGTDIPTDAAEGQVAGQTPAGAPANALPATLLSTATLLSDAPNANADKGTPVLAGATTGNIDGPAMLATPVAASRSPDAPAQARPADAVIQTTLQAAAQQPAAPPQVQQSQGKANEATAAKLAAGPENPLKTATTQQANTPAGAQVTGTQSVPDLRTTPSPDDASRFTSVASKTEASSGVTAAASQSANPGLAASLQSTLTRTIGNPRMDRVDSAGTTSLVDTLVPAREAVTIQNYNQQLRMAGEEVRAPVKSLAVDISTQARSGIRQFEIRMDPPELGRIDVRLDMKENGTVTTRLVVERAETLDLLQRDARFLERALSDNGLKLDEGGLRMSLKGDGSGQHGQAGARDFDEQAGLAPEQIEDDASIGAGDNETGDLPPPIHQMMVNGGIDIRV